MQSVSQQIAARGWCAVVLAGYFTAGICVQWGLAGRRRCQIM